VSALLIVAPHADDETLGCGGTMLRAAAEGRPVHWLLVSDLTAQAGFSHEDMARREEEIERVARHYRLAGVHRLHLPTTALEAVPRAKLVAALGRVLEQVQPEELYLPFPGDAHSDHRAVFAAGAACAKWFRQRSLRRLLAYETPSETDFGLDPTAAPFRPNRFLDITPHLEGKLAAMRIYAGELGEHPFPRSETAIRALAALRGAAAGCSAAEAFMLLWELL